MFEFARAFAVNRGWIKGPEKASAPKAAPADPITQLANRSQWTIDSIKSSIESLGSQNGEIQQEHNTREEAKNRLIQEQSALRNIRSINEAVIAKAATIFEPSKS